MKEKKVSKRRFGGISAKTLAIPILLIVAILHVSIVLLIIDINHSSNDLSNLMERAGAYEIDATSMMASNTVLAETSNNFLQMPVLPDESVNVGPLMAYVAELDSDRRSPKVAERFREYDVGYAIRSYVERASELSEEMVEIQCHAIAVMASVYPLPANPAFSIFSDVELTQEEINMTNEQRIAYARHLVVESDYAQRRFYVSECIENCNRSLQEGFSKASTLSKQHVTLMRNILWADIFVVIFVMTGAFAALFLMVIKPLGSYSKDIVANQKIKKYGSLSEMRQLVTSFNNLWEYRNKLEAFLRTEAENDALTGLPNRYCLERDLLEIESIDKSVAVFMFDVNFLKKTNDTKGHLAGDQLIRTVASCIKECFGTDKSNNCYRIGGDEFVVLLIGCNKEEIKLRLERFKFALTRENVSVSVGFAFDNKLESGGLKSLMEKADKSMYKQKKEIHELSEKQKKD